MKVRSKSISGLNWGIGETNNDIVLLCQNMNTSFIGSILSDFLDINIVIIDHLGPLNKLYKSFGKRLKKNLKYIVISDVYCLGTENKIAKNLIEFSGGNYLGNISVVRINTQLKEHISPNYCSLYTITKSNNPINYKIFTALEIEE